MPGGSQPHEVPHKVPLHILWTGPSLTTDVFIRGITTVINPVALPLGHNAYPVPALPLPWQTRLQGTALLIPAILAVLMPVTQLPVWDAVVGARTLQLLRSAHCRDTATLRLRAAWLQPPGALKKTYHSPAHQSHLDSRQHRHSASCWQHTGRHHTARHGGLRRREHLQGRHGVNGTTMPHTCPCHRPPRCSRTHVPLQRQVPPSALLFCLAPPLGNTAPSAHPTTHLLTHHIARPSHLDTAALHRRAMGWGCSHLRRRPGAMLHTWGWRGLREKATVSPGGISMLLEHPPTARPRGAGAVPQLPPPAPPGKGTADPSAREGPPGPPAASTPGCQADIPHPTTLHPGSRARRAAVPATERRMRMARIRRSGGGRPMAAAGRGGSGGRAGGGSATPPTPTPPPL